MDRTEKDNKIEVDVNQITYMQITFSTSRPNTRHNMISEQKGLHKEKADTKSQRTMHEEKLNRK